MSDIVKPSTEIETPRIPSIYVEAETLPEGWEKAVIRLLNEGVKFKTEHDRPGDPPSLDVTARIVVKSPLKEPRIHLSIPCGLDYLEFYRQEYANGIHDFLVDPNPDSTLWDYAYHERFAAYKLADGTLFNQLDYVVKKLIEAPYTRRAQAITWIPGLDNVVNDPPCLQRAWFRLIPDMDENGMLLEKPERYALEMHIDMRSNDGFKAAFMNMYAFTCLQETLAKRLNKEIDAEVIVGQYIHSADSFHIYGKDMGDDLDRFLKLYEEREFKDRVIRSDSSMAKQELERGFKNAIKDLEGRGIYEKGSEEAENSPREDGLTYEIIDGTEIMVS